MKPIKRKYKPTIVCDKCHKSIGKMKPSYKKVGEIEYRYWRCRHSLIKNTNRQQQERFDRQDDDLYDELYFDDSPY